MVLKNKDLQKLEKAADRTQHYGIRKLTIGAASVLLGTTLWLGRDAIIVKAADENTNSGSDAKEESSSNVSTPTIDDNTKAVVNSASDDSSNSSADISTSKETSSAANDVTSSEDSSKAVTTDKAAAQSSSADSAVTTNEQKSSEASSQSSSSIENKQADQVQSKISQTQDNNSSVNSKAAADAGQTGSKKDTNSSDLTNSLKTPSKDGVTVNNSTSKNDTEDTSLTGKDTQLSNVDLNKLTNTKASNNADLQNDLNKLNEAKNSQELLNVLSTINVSDDKKNVVKDAIANNKMDLARLLATNLVENNVTSIVKDADDYPSRVNPNLSKLFPNLTPDTGSQYIFDQFQLTYDKDNQFQPLDWMLTLATDRQNPTGSPIYYYVTDLNYNTYFDKGQINFPNGDWTTGDLTYTLPGARVADDVNVHIMDQSNYRPSITIKETNGDYSLARVFGYGQIDNESKRLSDSANSWGDFVPTKITQTVKYEREDGKQLETPVTSTGLIGQHFVVENANRVIPGYYLTNPSDASGSLADFEVGKTYTREWIDGADSPDLIIEHHTLQNSEGLMYTKVYESFNQGGWQEPFEIGEGYIPNNCALDVKGYYYYQNQNHQNIKCTTTYEIQNPYVKNTKDVVLIYAPLGRIIPVDKNGNEIPNVPNPKYGNDENDPTKGSSDNPVPPVPGYHISSVKNGEPAQPSNVTVTGNTGTVNASKDPGNDTDVIFIKDKNPTPPTPSKEQGSVTVNVHDDTDNIYLHNTDYDLTTGKKDAGTPVSYPLTEVEDDLTNRGYQIIKPVPTIPTEIVANQTPTLTIHVTHKYRQVTPTDPVDPTHPIDPDHPTNPVNNDPTPGLTKEDLQKTVTRTINYIFTDGTTAASHNINQAPQSVSFEGTTYIDETNGKLITVDPSTNTVTDWTKGSISWCSEPQKLDNFWGFYYD